jgi:hypothetical protein
MSIRPLLKGIVAAAITLLPVAVLAEDLQVTEMAVTTKIVRGNPIDSVHRISSTSVPALYCFTRISRDNESGTTIRHLWYRDDVKVAEYELPVKGTRWRTYSRKGVERESAGEWRVDAVDSLGKVVKSVTFRIN